MVSFNESVKGSAEFTGDTDRLERFVEGLQAWGGTSLYDAIHYSLGRIKDQPGRKAIIVFSDGADTTSSMEDREVVDYARAVEATVYSIGFKGSGHDGLQPARLPAQDRDGDRRASSSRPTRSASSSRSSTRSRRSSRTTTSSPTPRSGRRRHAGARSRSRSTAREARGPGPQGLLRPQAPPRRGLIPSRGRFRGRRPWPRASCRWPCTAATTVARSSGACASSREPRHDFLAWIWLDRPEADWGSRSR